MHTGNAYVQLWLLFGDPGCVLRCGLLALAEHGCSALAAKPPRRQHSRQHGRNVVLTDVICAHVHVLVSGRAWVRMRECGSASTRNRMHECAQASACACMSMYGHAWAPGMSMLEHAGMGKLGHAGMGMRGHQGWACLGMQAWACLSMQAWACVGMHGRAGMGMHGHPGMGVRGQAGTHVHGYARACVGKHRSASTSTCKRAEACRLNASHTSTPATP
eukprot:364741-Chlamydomonas_euryale.AAC.26